MKDFDLKLCLVANNHFPSRRSVEWVIREAAAGGVDTVLLGDKESSTAEFIARAILLKRLLKSFGVSLIINDRVDVALAAGADGVHLGESSMSYEMARKILGPEKIIGISVSTYEQAREAERLDPDYIGLWPVFLSAANNDVHVPMGLSGVMEIASLTKHKMVVCGGVDAGNVRVVLDAGVQGVAVASAIFSADDPAMAALEIRSHMMNHRANGI